MTDQSAAQRKADRINSAPIYAAMLAPIAGLMALAGVVIWEAVEEEERGKALNQMVALSTEASNLAHELQKERGMSAGHVGSKGAQFGAALKRQRAETDAVLAIVAPAVTAAEAAQGARQSDRAQRLSAAFAALAAKRGEIDRLAIPVSDVAKFYTGAIRDLLSLPDDPLLAGQLDALARQNAIYKDILMAKEFAGVERAAGSVGFGRGAFDNKTYAWYHGLQERQAYLFDRIRDLGDAAERARLEAALSSQAADRLRELRAIAEESLRSGAVNGVTGPEWFAASTAYLGELRKLERAMAAEIQIAAADRAAESFYWAIGLGAVVTLFTVGFGLFGFRYGHSMIMSLRGLRDAIQRIEGAEDGIVIPGVQRRDAVGEIARSLVTISSQGADAARVKSAILSADMPVMILDGAGCSVFENAAFHKFAEKCAAELRDLAPLQADGVRNASRLLAQIEAAESAGSTVTKAQGSPATEIRVDGVIFEARKSDVLDWEGQVIGATVEMADVTAVRTLENEVMEVLQGVERGEFSHRVRSIDNLGFTSLAARGLNSQMESIETFMASLEISLEAMAQGDLTKRMNQPFNGDFEQARVSVNDNLQALVDMVGAVSNAADQVQETAGPIAQGARNLAQRAEEQAAALEQVNATMEEMSGAIVSAADDARSSAELAATASDRAAAGHEVLSETRNAMSRIEGSAAKVVEIVTVIDSIAFQTNLLALNAAVEAARAGDAGKGFAVVASEVRTLAQRSSDAASEIRGLIDESTRNVSEGVALMERTKTALDEINASIEGLTSVIGSIAASGEAQALSAKEISTTTAHLDGLTQQNATVAQESARGAEELRVQADQLIEQVRRFVVDQAAAASRAA